MHLPVLGSLDQHIRSLSFISTSNPILDEKTLDADMICIEYEHIFDIGWAERVISTAYNWEHPMRFIFCRT
jgi:hypothetical protein